MKKDYNKREMLNPLTKKEIKTMKRIPRIDLMLDESERNKIKLIERLFK